MQKVTGTVAVLLVTFVTGCAVTPQQPEAPALANSARDQIGRLAVRGPTRPTVTLADELDGKGAAAGKTALNASAGWVGGTINAAADSAGEGGAVLLLLGLAATPVIAAGGAAYGAAVADTPEAVTEGNAVIARSLDFAPARLRQVLETELSDVSPVPFEFVAADTVDTTLTAAGFDTVLDIGMKRIASLPTADRIQVYFQTEYEFRLKHLRTGQVLATRRYWRDLEPRSVSGWAGRNATPLTTALHENFSDISSRTIEELFLAPAIRVRGLEPVSRGVFGTSTIPGRRPMFVWAALDGGTAAPQENVEYEILIGTRKQSETLRHRTRNLRFVPPESLRECTTYQWQVRAHYASFGEATVTDWTPKYLFRTECGK